MKKIKIGQQIVEMFDSIEELPIVRFHKFNKMLLIDSGIGSDLADFDKHMEKVCLYIARGKREEAVKEIENMRQNLYFIQQGLSPQHMAFAVLVHSINGRVCDDISDDGIKQTLSLLENVEKKDLTSSMDEVKKKIDQDLSNYFPRLFEDSRVKEYYDKLRERTSLILQNVISGGDDEKVEQRVKDITDDLVLYNRPQTFTGNNNSEVKYDKQFEKMCLIISQNLNVNPKSFSTLEYYNAYEYIDELNRKQAREARNKRF